MWTRLRGLGRTALAVALASLAVPVAAQDRDSASILIYDASGSMWGQLDGGVTKVEVAREVIGDFFVSRDNSIPLGVIAYGHNRRGDCSDIEVIADVGNTSPSELSKRLNQLNPRGMTPITESLSLAASMIPPTAESADIILVTDGLETCKADPCALAAQLAEEGIAIRAHVVGFGLTNEEAEAMACVADATGGLLLRPQTGQELADALRQVAQVAQPEPEPETSTLFSTHFVFRDTGTGTPRGLMEWTATAPDGTVIPLGTTEGTQQSLEGRSVQLPGGEWTIVAVGPEGRAELTFTLAGNGGSHGVPFVGVQMAAEIPPIGQVQAGMGARIPFTITHRGSGNLGGTPYKYIATGPEGALTRDQIVRDDLITSRELGTYGGATGALEPGTYRLLVAIARQSGYEILAERTFEAVENPIVSIVGPARAQPGEAVSLSFGGGYATNYHFFVVDENDRNLTQGRALYQGPGGGGGGPLSLDVRMPNQEGTFDIVVRRDNEIIARKPITLGDATAAASQAAPGQDDLPMVPATFRLPPGYPQEPHEWSATPLDPDMSPEAWAPSGKTVIGEGVFEPGRYEVTANWGPKDIFKGVVEILPGQANDFVIPVMSEEDPHTPTLDGPWQVLGVPPYQVQAGADHLLTLALKQADPDAPVSGRWTAADMLAGPQAAGREGTFTTASLEDGVLRMTFTVGDPIPEPMTLYLTPYGIGYAGTLSSGVMGISVVMWPGGYEPPSLAEMREAVHGPAPADFVDLTSSAPQALQAGETATGEVPVRLRTPFEIGDVGVQWSAIRTDVQEMDVAFASNDLETSFITSLAAGGTYEVEGVNADAGIYLADTITIDPNGRNDFEIPLAAGDGGASEEGFGEDVAFVCTNAPAGCQVNHAASGIALTLPNDWAMGEPYFYETAGGVRSELPTASFFWENSGTVNTIELNPRQWLDSNGRCETVGTGRLCYMRGQDMGLDVVFEMILDTLTVTPSSGEEAETIYPVDLGDMSADDFLAGLGLN